MNKNVVYTIVVVIVLSVIAGTGFLLTSSTNIETPTVADLPTSTSPNLEVDSRTEESSPKYLQYEKGQLEKYSDKRIVLFFYASWCPTCQPVDRDLRNMQSEIPDDVIVIRSHANDPNVSNEEEKQLEKDFNITYQHTFVILENGVETKRWTGDDFERILKELAS